MGDIPRPPDAQLFLSLARKQFGVLQVLDAGGADFAPDLARVAMRYAVAHEHIRDNKFENASACLMWGGKVVAWGEAIDGGDSASVQAQLTGVESIASTLAAFAAKTSEGKVVTWGHAYYGGDSASVQAQLTQVLHLSSSRRTFTATLRDGSKVSWPGQ